MKRGWTLVLIALNLLVLVALAFAYPHLMVAPGPLANGHAELASDCFACHVPLRGVASGKCVACHALPGIGLTTTKGVPLLQRKAKGSFHQELIEQDCVACHSDHQAPKLTHRSRKPFSHALLRPVARERCAGCHSAPENALHRDLSVGCAQCHKTEGWKPAAFDHALLASAVRERCEGCHKAPLDNLHRQVKGNCLQCHSQERWKPATFDHAKLFVLDRDHNTDCVTCHVGGDYARYTCYGCHEHTVDKIRRKHRKEGIADFENCVKCHRSASDEPERHGSGKRRERD